MPSLYVVRPSKSGWGVDDGNVAFLLGGYYKGVVVKGVARAVKKSGSSSPPLSETLPGGRGARGARSRGTEGRRGGTRSPATATDADACRLDRNGPLTLSAASAAPEPLEKRIVGAGLFTKTQYLWAKSGKYNAFFTCQHYGATTVISF